MSINIGYAYKLYSFAYKAKYGVDKFVVGVLPSAPITTPWGASSFP